jgi:hypothetical protein
MGWKEPLYAAKVESIKNSCSAGHVVGDEFEINTHKTGGICGYCYHDLFPPRSWPCAWAARSPGGTPTSSHTSAPTGTTS